MKQCSSCGGFGGRGHKCPTIREQRPRQFSDVQILELAKRHDVTGHIVDLRAMVEDAASMAPNDPAQAPAKAAHDAG